jgi:hypothetical protein
VNTIANFLLSMLFNMLGLSMSLAGGSSDALSSFGFQVAGNILGALIGAFINILLGMVFGAIGGVIYVAYKGRK